MKTIDLHSNSFVRFVPVIEAQVKWQIDFQKNTVTSFLIFYTHIYTYILIHRILMAL